MAINTELLARVRDHILEEPRRYDQEAIGVKSAEAPCGTAGCLYGWGAVLGGLITPQELREVGRYEDESVFEMDEVSNLFGFSYDEADIVVDRFGAHWPARFGERLRLAQEKGDKEGEARAAADYIDYIIASGKVTD